MKYSLNKLTNEERPTKHGQSFFGENGVEKIVDKFSTKIGGKGYNTVYALLLIYPDTPEIFVKPKEGQYSNIDYCTLIK